MHCILLTIFLFYFVRREEDHALNKRLLLNDPQVLQSQIDSLNKKLSSMESLLQTYQQDLPTLNNRVNGLESQQQNIKAITSNLQSQLSTGTTYTIWGRKSCPTINGTETVYSGIAGGSRFNENGNGANILCLPHNPDSFTSSIRYEQSNSGYTGHLQGNEYQFFYNSIAQDDVAPCAVCKVRTSSVLMIPAKNACPAGWTRQFKGFMTSSKYDRFKTEFLCIEENPEFMEGTRQQNYDGLLLYPVITVCGSLPCPPYKNNHILPCVVCTV